LTLAEKLSGSTQPIETVKAVALSNIGNWEESVTIFDKVITRADRYASPWWLRYSMALLETRRSTEAVVFLLRTVNRFPDEPECKAFAAALYTKLGSRSEALRYWDDLPSDSRDMYRNIDFLQSKLKWGPVSIASFKSFVDVK
jgi:tetratricopeptide (TPR) repeat protein